MHQSYTKPAYFHGRVPRILSRQFGKEGSPLPSLIGVGAIFLFASLNPPFITPQTSIYLERFRLLLESIILLCLVVSLPRSGIRYPILTLVLAIYLINYLVSGESLSHVLSHFNKFALLFMLASVLSRRRTLLNIATTVWITIWISIAVLALVGFLLYQSPVRQFGVLYSYSGYEYFSFPIIGNYLFRTTEFANLPRFAGYFFEPAIVSFFFAFNLLSAPSLIGNKKRRRVFEGLCFLGGLLTFSWIFFLFVGIYAVLRMPISSKVLKGVTLIALITVGMLLAVMSPLGLSSLPYSSSNERVQRYDRSVQFLSMQTPSKLIFGAGVEPFHQSIGSGASAAFLDLLASRGLLIAAAWLYVLYATARPIAGLILIIALYGLVIDYWHFPLFIIGLAIVVSLRSPFSERRSATASPVRSYELGRAP